MRVPDIFIGQRDVRQVLQRHRDRKKRKIGDALKNGRGSEKCEHTVESSSANAKWSAIAVHIGVKN